MTQLRGDADQLLRVKNNPTDPPNGRISILVRNQEGPMPDLKGGEVAGGPIETRSRNRLAVLRQRQRKHTVRLRLRRVRLRRARRILLRLFPWPIRRRLQSPAASKSGLITTIKDEAWIEEIGNKRVI